MGFLEWNYEYLRSLENKLVLLTNQAEQDRHNIGRRYVDDLLENSKKLLMLPFSTLAGELSQDCPRPVPRPRSKEAELVIRGGEVEIDKRVLDETKDAFIHILRNCRGSRRGIAGPASRGWASPPARRSITIAVAPVNGSKGGDHRIRRRGRRRSGARQGVGSPSSLSSPKRTRSFAERAGRAWLALIFQSEVSTSPIVTTVSGPRDLGMAIVRSKRPRNWAGEITIQSKPAACGDNSSDAAASYAGDVSRHSGGDFRSSACGADRQCPACPKDQVQGDSNG